MLDVLVKMPVKLVPSGEPSYIQQITQIPIQQNARLASFQLVHRTIRDLVMHELDEQITFDGEHINDPHEKVFLNPGQTPFKRMNYFKGFPHSTDRKEKEV